MENKISNYLNPLKETEFNSCHIERSLLESLECGFTPYQGAVHVFTAETDNHTVRMQAVNFARYMGDSLKNNPAPKSRKEMDSLMGEEAAAEIAREVKNNLAEANALLDALLEVSKFGN